ncbi:MAG: TerB family tellurite resistance protein [Alphaproteobacteria bacterium]|nr:TerB family tellurite resistance protein [Alphaproteobacteria bacterium]
MINRIKALFADREGRGEGAGGAHGHDDLHLAAAALMVEAACLDGDFDDRERAKINDLLRHHFQLSAEESGTLLDAAAKAQATRHQLLPYTRIVKERFSEAERIELVEMLWEVAYADGELHDYEANLLRRIGGLIYVPDLERGAARRRVLERLQGAAEGEVERPEAAERLEVRE